MTNETELFHGYVQDANPAFGRPSPAQKKARSQVRAQTHQQLTTHYPPDQNAPLRAKPNHQYPAPRAPQIDRLSGSQLGDQ